MATEVDLKVLKIELKVSANCCEGCEKKVKKALKGIEGILKTDIDPWRPKVTVLGNVDPQILIKRLLKVGKHAELDGFEELKASKKEAETIAVARGKEKEKHPDEYEHKTQKDEDIRGGGGYRSKNKYNNNDSCKTPNASNPPLDLKKGNTLTVQQGVDLTFNPPQDLKEISQTPHPYNEIKFDNQLCYIAQPWTANAPYCAIASSAAASQLPTSVQVHYHYDKPTYQPPFLRPTARVDDYLSDDNAVGCNVM